MASARTNRIKIGGKERILSWKPDVPDARDYLFSDRSTKKRLFKAVPIPDKVDLTSLMSSIEDQKNLGSCVSHALTSSYEYLWQNRKTPAFKTNFSRLFVYYNSRKAEGNVNSDDGTQIRTGVKTMSSEGVCLEPTWPYRDTIAAMVAKPTNNAYEQARRFRVTKYARIVSLNDMLNCLAQKIPFAAGIAVYSSFDYPLTVKTGRVVLPNLNTENMLGGHAILIVGYDKSKRIFIGRNSWGVNWGKAGYFTIPFAYLTDRNLSDDLWALVV